MILCNSKTVEEEIVEMEKEFKLKHTEKQSKTQLLMMEVKQAQNENNSLKATLKDFYRSHYLLIVDFIVNCDFITTELKEAKAKRDSQTTSLADIRRRQYNVVQCTQNVGFYFDYLFVSVDMSKNQLSSEAEAGIRLSSEKKELEYRLLTLRETHKYYYYQLLLVIIIYIYAQGYCAAAKGRAFRIERKVVKGKKDEVCLLVLVNNKNY